MSVGKKLSFGFFTIIMTLIISLVIMFIQFSNIEKKVENALENRVTTDLSEKSSDLQAQINQFKL